VCSSDLSTAGGTEGRRRHSQPPARPRSSPRKPTGHTQPQKAFLASRVSPSRPSMTERFSGPSVQENCRVVSRPQRLSAPPNGQ
jgi:hypothetical protein